MSSLRKLAEGRTSIFVAHRLSTIANCDKIYVMRDGRVVEEGTHSSLLKSKGLYHEMWSLQESEHYVDGISTSASPWKDIDKHEAHADEKYKVSDPDNSNNGKSSSNGGVNDRGPSDASNSMEDLDVIQEAEVTAIRRTT